MSCDKLRNETMLDFDDIALTGTFRIRSAVDDRKCVDASGPSLSLNDCSTDKVSQYFGWDIKTNAIYLSPDKGDLKPGSMCITMPEEGKQGAVLALVFCNATNTLQQWTAVMGPPQPIKGNEIFYFSTPSKMCLDL